MTQGYTKNRQGPTGTIGPTGPQGPPSGASTITIDMTQVASNVTAFWVDPTTGKFIIIGKLHYQRTKSFSTPGNNAYGAADWVLYLQPTVNIHFNMR